MVLHYRSGEEIRKGDRVLFHGNPGAIEFVATDPDDPEQVWYVAEFGGGGSVLDPLVSGRTFIPADHISKLRGFGVCFPRVSKKNGIDLALALVFPRGTADSSLLKQFGMTS